MSRLRRYKGLEVRILCFHVFRKIQCVTWRKIPVNLKKWTGSPCKSRDIIINHFFLHCLFLFCYGPSPIWQLQPRWHREDKIAPISDLPAREHNTAPDRQTMLYSSSSNRKYRKHEHSDPYVTGRKPSLQKICNSTMIILEVAQQRAMSFFTQVPDFPFIRWTKSCMLPLLHERAKQSQSFTDWLRFDPRSSRRQKP